MGQTSDGIVLDAPVGDTSGEPEAGRLWARIDLAEFARREFARRPHPNSPASHVLAHVQLLDPRRVTCRLDAVGGRPDPGHELCDCPAKTCRAQLFRRRP